MDICKKAPEIYHYTTIDDSSRYRVPRCDSRCIATNKVDSIECVLEEMRFSIQRIQRDRGHKFFAEKVQKRHMMNAVEFLPNKPSFPNLNVSTTSTENASIAG